MIVRRSIAYIIDYLILWTIILLGYLLGHVAINTFSYETADTIVLVLFYLGPIFILVYMSLKDFAFANASVGKRLFDLQVVSTVSKNISKMQLVSRNLIGLFLLPIEVILVLTGQTRMGDHYAKTKVVLKNYK